MLKAERVECRLKKRVVLEDVSIEVRPGDAIGVIGPNGAGKTTLLRTLGGLLRPSSGSVLLDGKSIFDIPDRVRARTVAYVSQDPHVGFGFTVADTVAMGRYPYRGRFSSLTAEDREAIDAAMRVTDTSGLKDRPTTELSGGEKQRVFLARALAQQPSLLLLDEPIANLDIRYQLEILELIASLNREKGLTVVMAIHDLTWALRYCRSILALSEGRVAAFGPSRSTLTDDLVRSVFSVRARVIQSDSEALIDWRV